MRYTNNLGHGNSALYKVTNIFTGEYAYGKKEELSEIVGVKPASVTSAYAGGYNIRRKWRVEKVKVIYKATNGDKEVRARTLYELANKLNYSHSWVDKCKFYGLVTSDGWTIKASYVGLE